MEKIDLPIHYIEVHALLQILPLHFLLLLFCWEWKDHPGVIKLALFTVLSCPLLLIHSHYSAFPPLLMCLSPRVSLMAPKCIQISRVVSSDLHASPSLFALGLSVLRGYICAGFRSTLRVSCYRHASCTMQGFGACSYVSVIKRTLLLNSDGVI